MQDFQGVGHLFLLHRFKDQGRDLAVAAGIGSCCDPGQIIGKNKPFSKGSA
jgi:hypothetical protein